MNSNVTKVRIDNRKLNRIEGTLKSRTSDMVRNLVVHLCSEAIETSLMSTYFV